LAGSFGRLAVFSFNGNKIMTASSGGMLVSKDPALIERARFLATQARDPAPHYQHSVIGYNYRLSNLLAAVGRGQLKVLPEHIDRRREINTRYRETLGDLPGLTFSPIASDGRPNFWLTCLTIDPTAFGASREDIRLALESENIEARPVWKPMHLQPVFAKSRCRGGAVAEELFAQGLCLPSGSSLTDEDLDRIVAVIRCLAR
jgi:pyridoxal phosphate-dependent aminotransferase EpsN